MSDGNDHSPTGFLRQDGGLHRDAIGCKFRGKKAGTWRQVNGLTYDGYHISYSDHRGREASCWISTFFNWIDRKATVALPVIGKDQR